MAPPSRKPGWPGAGPICSSPSTQAPVEVNATALQGTRHCPILLSNPDRCRLRTSSGDRAEIERDQAEIKSKGGRMANRTEGTFTLPQGRTLTFRDEGDAGRPAVLFQPGFMACR